MNCPRLRHLANVTQNTTEFLTSDTCMYKQCFCTYDSNTSNVLKSTTGPGITEALKSTTELDITEALKSTTGPDITKSLKSTTGPD